MTFLSASSNQLRAHGAVFVRTKNSKAAELNLTYLWDLGITNKLTVLRGDLPLDLLPFFTLTYTLSRVYRLLKEGYPRNSRLSVRTV